MDNQIFLLIQIRNVTDILKCLLINFEAHLILFFSWINELHYSELLLLIDSIFFDLEIFMENILNSIKKIELINIKIVS